VVGRLLAVQSQDLHAATLAIRARSTGTTAARIAGLLGDERALVVTWLNRGTLHMVRSEDYWWLHALTSRVTKAAVARRLRQEGLTPGDARVESVTPARELRFSWWPTGDEDAASEVCLGMAASGVRSCWPEARPASGSRWRTHAS